MSELISMIKTEPCALATDGSNDEGLIKMNPLTVRYFDTAKHSFHSIIGYVWYEEKWCRNSV